MKITMATNAKAVVRGLVYPNFVKQIQEIVAKITGDPAACVMRVVCNDVTAMPTNIIAPHRAQPSNPNAAITRYSLAPNFFIELSSNQSKDP
jgi:hypothetical protein